MTALGLLLCAMALVPGLPPSGAVAKPGDVFNAGWSFFREGEPAQAVDLPHDAAIAHAFDPATYGTGCGALPYYGRVTYENAFEASEADVEALGSGAAEWRLEFDGVMSHARVSLNGEELYSRPNGYASFVVPVTRKVRPGRNVVRVTAESPRESSRWYPGLGLYRDVRLVKRGGDCLVPGSVTIVMAELTAEKATVEARWCQARSGEHRKTFTFSRPELWMWSPEHPNLVTLEFGGETFRYGLRTLRYSPDEGFFLNGRHRQMRGVCLHHDLGLFGAAFVRDAARRQLALLKEMGCDAIRTSHNFPAPALLDLCDEMGFLVLDEAFDEWQGAKIPHGMAENWSQWGRREAEDFVRRDRNHPCVVMWSAGNELAEDEPNSPLTAQGVRIARELTEIFHANDPERRPVTAGHWRDNTITNGIGAATDVFGANYLPHRYAEFKGRQGVVGTETCSTVSTRGTFVLPVDAKYAVTNRVSDYGLCPMHVNDYPPDAEFAAQDANPHVYGEFVWTGFDYLGEPDPWRGTARSSFFGIFDLSGFPKARYWQYRAQWRPDVPTAKIVPDWNRRPGERVPVHVFTSGDEAELFLNGRSLGRRRKGSAYRIVWDDVAFEPGELKVVSWKGGRPWAEDRVETSGAFARFEIKDEIYGDFLFREYVAVDARGRFVPDAAVSVPVLSPNGWTFYGACNGDPGDLTSLRSPAVRTFSGRALVVFARPCAAR